MSGYVYKDPCAEGYRKVKISKADHRRLFPARPLKWHNRFEYYLRDDAFLIHRFVSAPAVALNTILFPVMLLAHGLTNFKMVWRDHYGTIKQKETGSFSSDKVWSSSAAFPEIVKAAT